jgi:hypothetical protein
MIKVHALTTCKHYGDEAYIPVGEFEGCKGEKYTR